MGSSYAFMLKWGLFVSLSTEAGRYSSILKYNVPPVQKLNMFSVRKPPGSHPSQS